MTKWISQPPSAVICLLSSLCTALLFIIIILLVTITRSLSNDQQRILEALGDLADEIWKGNSSTYALCGKNWVLHDSSCYFLFRKVQTWDTAKKNCEDRKSHLVVINSDDEMNFLRQFSLSLSLWIGLTDKDGSWQWVDKTPYEKTPKFWNIGQPDDWYGHGRGGGEDCGQLVDGDGWNDNYCSHRFAYICEKTLSS
uniref:C-type lectin domain-containing protein n=1 Tax=Pyxicephalus adspersus TaxID=30357 RepID=A0AAV3AVN3_PYXAD|nr:TPA: hypothetical protein GDO54_005684 [Pyxicephalus adspersus]